ncbi:MAG: methyltransferase domain-containing protein [Candidatus Sumerlaeia bacterium]
MRLFRKKTPPPASTDAAVRERIAAEYLRGSGLEIGALHSPMHVPTDVRVVYVDRLSVEELRRHYPELADRPIVAPDIIADGQTLAPVGDGTQDFVIASHFLEHCENPILALCHMLRVLRPGGVVFLAVPDKRRTFDAARPVTPLNHLWRDFEDGPQVSRRDHYLEWAALVDKLPPQAAAEEAAHYMNIGYSIHFHVWRPHDVLELLLSVRSRLALPFQIERFELNGGEVIAVLRKEADAPGDSDC